MNINGAKLFWNRMSIEQIGLQTTIYIYYDIHPLLGNGQKTNNYTLAVIK
jgi:hypothetical protein